MLLLFIDDSLVCYGKQPTTGVSE